MAAQLKRYNLSVIDYWTSKDLSKAEAERSYCLNCQGYSSCQFDSQRGFKPHISVLEKEYRGEKVREIYLARQECSYRLALKTTARNHRLFQDSRIPKEYTGKNLSNIARSSITRQNVQAYSSLLELIKAIEDGTGSIEERQLYLEGYSGSGKTYLVSLAGNEALTRGKTVLYKSLGEVLTKLRYEREDYSEELKRIVAADLVILEDLRADAPEFYAEQILTIIDRRQREEGGLIVTSSTEIEGIMTEKGEVGEQLRNRLRRMKAERLE